MDKKLKYGRAAAFLIPAIRTVFIIAVSMTAMLLPGFRGKTFEEVSRWWMLICVPANILTIAALWLMLKKEGRSIKTLFANSLPGRRTWKQVITAVILMILLGMGGLMGISFLVYGYMPVTLMQPLPVWAAVLSVLLLPVTVVFAEIPFYLGYCIPKMEKATGNKILAAFYPLFFYALQHCFMPVIFDAQYMLSRFLVFVPLLIMLGIWYTKKRDIVPLMIGHGVLDLMAALQIFVLSVYPPFFEIISRG